MKLTKTKKTLTRLWWGWALFYFASGGIAMQQGDTGVFARPVDEVESWPLRLIFLNFPLQMLLAISAHTLWSDERATRKAAGTCLGLIASLLIAVNFCAGCWFVLA